MQDTFSHLSKNSLIGQQDVKQQTNFTFDPVHVFLTNTIYTAYLVILLIAVYSQSVEQ